MKNQTKVNNVIITIIALFIIVILGDIALPIIYRYFMNFIYLLTPFILGFFFAYLLHKLVDKIEEQGINRMLSVFLVFFTFIILIIYLISNLIPIMSEQINQLENQIPEMYNSLENFLNDLWYKFDFIPDKYRFNMNDLQKWTENLFNVRVDGQWMNNLMDSFNLIFLTPVIIFYFLYDYNNIKKRLGKFLRKHNYIYAYRFLKETDEDVGEYFRGLILVMNLMTIASGLGFYLIGLDYPILFGFLVGYTNAIPVIGNYIGGVPAVFFALTKSWQLAILSLLVVVIVQLIETNIVTPYIQSKSIDCHPLLILLAFIIFGKYFGLVGMVFAIPLLAVLMLIIKYWRIYLRLKRLKEKRLKSV